MSEQQVAPYAGFQLADMSEKVRRFAETYGFDTNKDGSVSAADDLAAALARVQRDPRRAGDVAGPSPVGAQIFAARLVTAATDPSVSLRSDTTAGAIQRATAGGARAVAALLSADPEALAGASVDERLDMLQLLMLEQSPIDPAHEELALRLLEGGPAHQEAELCKVITEQDLLPRLLDAAGSEQALELMQQFFHQHLWNLGSTDEIIEALQELDVVDFSGRDGKTDFAGLMYVLSTVRANKGDAAAEELAATLEAAGVFARLLPFVFGAGRPEDRYVVAGLGAVSPEEYRQHVENLFDVLPAGPTRAALYDRMLQRLEPTTTPAERVVIYRERPTYVFSHLYAYPVGYRPPYVWRYTPVGGFCMEDSLVLGYGPLWWRSYRIGGTYYGTHAVHIYVGGRYQPHYTRRYHTHYVRTHRNWDDARRQHHRETSAGVRRRSHVVLADARRGRVVVGRQPSTVSNQRHRNDDWRNGYRNRPGAPARRNVPPRTRTGGAHPGNGSHGGPTGGHNGGSTRPRLPPTGGNNGHRDPRHPGSGNHGGPAGGPTGGHTQPRNPGGNGGRTEPRNTGGNSGGRDPRHPGSGNSGGPAGGHAQPRNPGGNGGRTEPRNNGGAGGRTEPHNPGGAGGRTDPRIPGGNGGRRDPRIPGGNGGRTDPRNPGGNAGHREPRTSPAGGNGGHREPRTSPSGGGHTMPRTPSSSGGGHREPRSSGSSGHASPRGGSSGGGAPRGGASSPSRGGGAGPSRAPGGGGAPRRRG